MPTLIYLFIFVSKQWSNFGSVLFSINPFDTMVTWHFVMTFAHFFWIVSFSVIPNDIMFGINLKLPIQKELADFLCQTALQNRTWMPVFTRGLYRLNENQHQAMDTRHAPIQERIYLRKKLCRPEWEFNSDFIAWCD